MNEINVNVRLPEELVRWIDENVRLHIFDSRSHAVRQALYFLKSFYEKQKKAYQEIGIK